MPLNKETEVNQTNKNHLGILIKLKKMTLFEVLYKDSCKINVNKCSNLVALSHTKLKIIISININYNRMIKIEF